MHFKDILKKSVLLSIVFLTVVLSSCFFSAPEANLVTPVIRVLEAPSASMVDSVVLTVSGPDMDDVEVSYSTLPDMISIAIPEGDNRTFELEINMNSSFPGTIKSFRGTATADITSDSATVTLGMGIGSTKIIVPDTYNNRLVQIDDISGSGWTTLTQSEILGGTITFIPSDVDFDSDGNFYVANSDTGGVGGVYKFFAITYTEPVALIASGVYGTTAVAVDRVNGRLYAVYNNSVYYTSISSFTSSSGTLLIDLSSAMEMINGIAIDDSGNIFLCGDEGNGGPWLVKYSSLGVLLSSYSSGGPTYTFNDVVYYNNDIYVSAENGIEGGAQIFKFNPEDLSVGPVESYGALNPGSSNVGDFYGPHNFLATMNNHLTIMDFESGNSFSRLVSFDDITGKGWQSYGNFGIGDGEFVFTTGMEE